MNKQELRQHIRTQKSQFTDEELVGLSRPIIERLLAHPAIVCAGTILMYHSLPDEVFTHEAINRLVSDGKHVLLPRVIDGENIELRIYKTPDDLRRGAFGIMEPSGTLFRDYAAIDVAVIPGMSFDSSCNRLGRGKGYYDRFLAQTPDVFKVGVCFDFQKLPIIPASEHDIRMDVVI